MALAAALFVTFVPLVAAGGAPVKVGAPGLSSLNLDDRTTAYYSDFVANRLSEQDGVTVVKSSEIAQLIGLEKQKQLLGCSEQGCAVEIAQALGVDAILSGSIGRFGEVYQVDVRLVSTRDGALLASDSARVEGDTALLEQLTSSAEKLAREVQRSEALHRSSATGGADGSGAEATAHPAAGGLRRFGWIPIAVGAGALAGGGYFTYQAAQENDRLKGAATASEAIDARNAGKSRQLTAQVLVASGVVLVGAGAALYMFGGQDALAGVAVLPAKDGGFVAVSGRFP